MDKILAGVEAHLRHELELSDYASASIRNAGQIPERLRARQLKEEAAYGRIWRRLFDGARADGQLRSDLDARHAQFSPPSSRNRKEAVFLDRATGRMARSTLLVSSSMRPSSRNRCSPAR